MVYNYIDVVDYELVKEIIGGVRSSINSIKDKTSGELKREIEEEYNNLLDLEDSISVNTVEKNKEIIKKYSSNLKKVINGEEDPTIFLKNYK